MTLNLSIRRAALISGFAFVCAVAGPSEANDSLDGFSALANARIDNELPAESSGSAASVTRTLRPSLGYPTLRLDGRNERPAAVTDEAPSHRGTVAAPLATEFADLVASTLGMRLPIYAESLFGEPSDEFRPVDQVNVPADFRVGPGDELHIQAWGSIEVDLLLTVDRTGCIRLPKVGEIPLAGVAFRDLESRVSAALGRAYRGFNLSVSLGRLKSIRVYVAGFAAAPGSYTVNSLSSLVNAIFLSGGPAPTGDLRRVELRRAGKTVTTVDLYRFLVHGERQQDVRLQPDDLIYIPALYGQAAIAGSVNQPSIFQVAPHDTLADLVSYAGGLSPSASDHRVVVERFGASGERYVEEFSLADPGLLQPVAPGDIVLIKPSSPRFVNAVTLRGHVAQPLRHQWRPGMRVSDMLPTAEALISPAYWARRNAEDPVKREAELAERNEVDVDFPDINWSYALIERIERASASVNLLPFRLKKAIIERDPEHDLVLQPGDILTVFALDEFRVPVDSVRRFVRIEGEVAHAGIYPVTATETLHDLIEKAGGLTGNAYLYGLELKRESVRQQQQRRKHEAIDRLDEDYQRHLIERSRNVLSGDLSLAIAPESVAISSLIQRLRALEPTGRIVIELDHYVTSVDELPRLTLRDQDRIYIPPRPETVEIVGAVLQSGSTLYEPDRRVKDYLARSGLIRTADTSETYLVRPNGSFKKAGGRDRLRPGDTVVVPEKVDRLSAVRRLKDWTQVLYQLGLGAAGIKILTDD